MNDEEIIKKINDAANIIAQKSRYGSTNYIVVSSEVAEAFKNLDPIIKLRKDRKRKLEDIFNIDKNSSSL